VTWCDDMLSTYVRACLQTEFGEHTFSYAGIIIFFDPGNSIPREEKLLLYYCYKNHTRSTNIKDDIKHETSHTSGGTNRVNIIGNISLR